MDKIIYAVLGAAALILAAVDQTESRQPQEQSPSTTVAVPPLSQGQGWHVSVTTQSEVPVDYMQPVNPIPQAADLGGKVIDDRFQPDG